MVLHLSLLAKDVGQTGIIRDMIDWIWDHNPLLREVPSAGLHDPDAVVKTLQNVRYKHRGYRWFLSEATPNDHQAKFSHRLVSLLDGYNASMDVPYFITLYNKLLQHPKLFPRTVADNEGNIMTSYTSYIKFLTSEMPEFAFWGRPEFQNEIRNTLLLVVQTKYLGTRFEANTHRPLRRADFPPTGKSG